MVKESLAERRAALLHAGAQVSRNIISILDPDVLLTRTVDIICDEFGFYYAGVFLLDEDGEWAVLRSGRGEAGAQMVAEGHKLRVGGLSMIGAATGRKQALIALDVGDEPVHFKNPHLPLTRSEMALPLAVGDEVIGALTVQSKEEAAFTEDDITALQAMADQLAIAINNARLHTENRRVLREATRRARLLEAAAEVGKGVTSILDLDELLNKTVDIICDAYGFYYAGVFMLDDAREWAVLRAGRGDAGQAMLSAGHKLRVGGLSMIGTSVVERRALIALDVGDEPVHFKNPHLPLTRSEMALPLLVGNQVIGAVTVQSVEEAAFSDEDIASLQAMADQLAIALDNARLLHELEAAHAELVRTKTFEAIATATLEAIHWIGNKALPISASVNRLRDDMEEVAGADEELLLSIREDLTLISDSAQVIVQVQEHLIGPAREQKPMPVMLDDVVKDTVTAMGIPAEVVIDYNVAADLPLAFADTTQLSRALGYVLRNALEATEELEKSQIDITIAPTVDKKFVQIVIADNGPGIPEEEMDKIWATFYTTKGVKHAGLGLPACLQILKQLDGKIQAENSVTGGANFTLSLPVFAGKLPAVEFVSGKSYLLIDDVDPWSIFVKQTLSEAGNTVTRVAGGDVDFSEVGTAFDAILVDDLLESTKSIKVLGRIAKAGVGAKTWVFTSSLRVERMMELMRFGIRDVVIKPYTPAALAERLA
ncbi:MAG: GAF domain-containing protein [Anaerolineae bacterium]|nr:GAF domain-containing protein [Anaerolineae bacterium]